MDWRVEMRYPGGIRSGVVLSEIGAEKPNPIATDEREGRSSMYPFPFLDEEILLEWLLPCSRSPPTNSGHLSS